MSEKLHLQLILDGCRAKNPKSQKLLYKHFFGYSMNICLRFSECKEAAEEILNDAFLKVFQNIDKYKNEFPFRPWLRKILINTAVDYYRAHQNYIKGIFLKDMADVKSEERTVKSAEKDVLQVVQQLPPNVLLTFNVTEIHPTWCIV